MILVSGGDGGGGDGDDDDDESNDSGNNDFSGEKVFGDNENVMKALTPDQTDSLLR